MFKYFVSISNSRNKRKNPTSTCQPAANKRRAVSQFQNNKSKNMIDDEEIPQLNGLEASLYLWRVLWRKNQNKYTVLN